jgi:hypothetical protein
MGYSASAQVQQAWVARYNNGMLNGTNQPVKMVLDPYGNIYVTGFSENTNGELGYVTMEYAPNGNPMWAARFDSTNYPKAAPTAMALDPSNNVIVTGYSVTIKYASNGAQLWSVPLGPQAAPVTIDSSETLYPTAAVAVDAGGNIYVTGFGTNFNTEKLSPGGSNLWMVNFKDVGPTISQAVMVDSATNIYVAGSDTDLLFGDPGSATQSYSRLLVCKYSGAGNFLWSTNYAPGVEVAVTVVGTALDTGNNCYVLVNDHNYPFWTTKFSADGNVSWATANPTGHGFSLGYSIVLDNLNDVLITGQNSYEDPESSQSQYGTYKLLSLA